MSNICSHNKCHPFFSGSFSWAKIRAPPIWSGDTPLLDILCPYDQFLPLIPSPFWKGIERYVFHARTRSPGFETSSLVSFVGASTLVGKNTYSHVKRKLEKCALDVRFLGLLPFCLLRVAPFRLTSLFTPPAPRSRSRSAPSARTNSFVRMSSPSPASPSAAARTTRTAPPPSA